MWMFLGICSVYIFINSSAKAGCNTRSFFMQGLTGLKRDPNPLYYFTHSWRENSWIHTFPKVMSAMQNINSLVQSVNSDHHVHFL